MWFGLVLSVLPLGIDTFAIAASAGTGRPSGPTRWRISAVFIIFEGGMPLVGLALGAGIAHAIGGLADYLSGGLLVLVGGYLWWADDDDDEVTKTPRLTSARGLALVGLALSISLDELAIGFGLGLGTHLTEPATIIGVIAIQTLLLSQLGLALGARIRQQWREYLERFTAPLMIVLGVYLLDETLIRNGTLTTRHTVAISALMLILGSLAIYRRDAARNPWMRLRRRSSLPQRSVE